MDMTRNALSEKGQFIRVKLPPSRRGIMVFGPTR